MKRIYKVWMACLTLACGAGWTGCADSLEDMKKENYEANWIKTFGKVDPNHTWNIAIQAEAELAIKEDALTEYTFKIYDNDPIWGTEAQLLAKATVKTDANGFACTQLKFDAPASLEQYYITRTDSHGRRLLKVSDIENQKINVEFGIYHPTNEDSGSRLIVETLEFPTYSFPYNIDELKNNAINLTDKVKNNQNRYEIKNDITNDSKTAIFQSNETITITSVLFAKWDNNDIYKIIFDGNFILNVTTNEYQLKDFEFIITPGSSLTINCVNDKGIEMQNNSKIYVMQNATLTALQGQGLREKAAIYLNDNQNQQAGSLSQTVIYNEGRINANYIALNVGDIYNMESGIIEITNTMDFVSEIGGTLTNYGRIKAKTIEGNGQSNNQNNRFELAGQHGTINNACFLDVTDKVNIKYLNIGANSAVESDTVIINDLSLRASSILRTEHFAAQNATWKFVGNANEDRALISANIIEYLHNGGTTITGPIYVEADSLSSKLADRETIINQTVKDSGITPGWGKIGSAPFLIIPDGFYDDTDISKADCVGHGNIPAEFAKIVDKDIQWIVAFEDLGSTGDYDFNDAVVGLVHRKSENKLIITPLAAGGTLPATLYYDNTELGEIHSLLGGSNTNTPINVDHRGKEGTKKEISVAEDFSITENWYKLKIKVKDQASEFILQPSREKGAVPQAICMPAPWFWAKEGIDIKDAYIQFEGWSQDSGSNLKWHQNPTREKVALQ